VLHAKILGGNSILLYGAISIKFFNAFCERWREPFGPILCGAQLADIGWRASYYGSYLRRLKPLS
jgi:hypothetical protein